MGEDFDFAMGLMHWVFTGLALVNPSSLRNSSAIFTSQGCMSLLLIHSLGLLYLPTHSFKRCWPEPILLTSSRFQKPFELFT